MPPNASRCVAALRSGVDAGLDAGLELLLGSTCAGCGAPGRGWCGPCDRSLPTTASAAWPTPPPAGLVRPAAAGEYDGTVRTLVLAHKEQGRLPLVRPLGRLLALAVADGWRAAAPGRVLPSLARPPSSGILLVPVPSHPAVVRQRGHDPVLRMSQAAAAHLRSSGFDARVLPVLRVARRPEDQSGLDAVARFRNLSGRFAARRGPARAARAAPELEVVVVDDVLTTGATLREAQRALEAAGVVPVGAAAVAATRRRVALRPERPRRATRDSEPDRSTSVG